jgi:hypothetical protein
VVWLIFMLPIPYWVALVPPYCRALWAAMEFNLKIDGLLLAALESNTEEAAFLTNFLAGLHQLNRLYISPFGFKFTPANVVQVFVPLLAALAQVVGKQMLV